MVLAIGDAVVEVPVGPGVVAAGAMQFMQVRVREAGLVLDSVLERDRQRPPQHGLPVTAGEPQDLRLDRRRPALDRGYAEAGREFLGAPGEPGGRVQATRGYSGTRRGCCRPTRVRRWGPAVPGWRRRPRPRRGPHRRGTAATTPRSSAVACRPRRGGLRPPASSPAPGCKRPPHRASGRSSTARSPARSSGPRCWQAPRRPRTAARARTARRLPDVGQLRAQHGPPRGMLQGRRTVAGLFCVKGQPGVIVAAEIAQSLQYPGVESERRPARPSARWPDARSRAGSAEPDGRLPARTR